MRKLARLERCPALSCHPPSLANFSPYKHSGSRSQVNSVKARLWSGHARPALVSGKGVNFFSRINARQTWLGLLGDLLAWEDFSPYERGLSFVCLFVFALLFFFFAIFFIWPTRDCTDRFEGFEPTPTHPEGRITPSHSKKNYALLTEPAETRLIIYLFSAQYHHL